MSRIDITHNVHHIHQDVDGICWAAAFAMVLGRRNFSDAVSIANGVGLDRNNAFIQPNLIPIAFQRNGLQSIPVPATLTVQSLANIIRPHAAVFFITLRPGWFEPGTSRRHAIVVTSMHGDGSPQTNVSINDPRSDGTAVREFSFLNNHYWSSIDFIGRRP